MENATYTEFEYAYTTCNSIIDEVKTCMFSTFASRECEEKDRFVQADYLQDQRSALNYVF